MDNPAYHENDVVYLRESASIGFLEAIRIGSIIRYNGQWLYGATNLVKNPIAPPFYGDRITVSHTGTVFYTEDELITICEALDMAEENAQRVLDAIRVQKANLCPTS